jgi:hypothetical protein
MVSSSIRRYIFLVVFMMFYLSKLHKTCSNVSLIIAMKWEVKCMEFGVLVAMLMKSESFWDTTLCIFLYRYRIVGQISCFNLH